MRAWLPPVPLDGLSVKIRYWSVPQRERARQAVYRAARKAGVQVSVRSDGGDRGYLRAVRLIEGQCLERRKTPRPELREHSYDPAKDEAADLKAVRQMLAVIRSELIAERYAEGLVQT